ncbi:Receptor-like protein kinase [Quillaja saponaria]|uniref:Receptor-like protein kinase n=1 Tax=Quillaja saponaria TaxID=32244 RepID=A0AAD7PXP1_QUISA|nr:Receptor-like protein kinase [Quillaja saponaria]
MPPGCFGFSKRESKNSNVNKFFSTLVDQELCRRFSLAEIQKATNNFDWALVGHDAFGEIYRGYIQLDTNTNSATGTKIRVTIKRSSMTSSQGLHEFNNEVQWSCQLCHPNLVSLLGFCYEENKNEKILVYEHMSNGSLHEQLIRTRNLEPLSWKKRLQICIGAARGLHYLHSGAKYAIIHGDFSRKSILLDETWTPKLTNFSLSTRGPRSTSKKLIEKVSSRIASTCESIAPEYLFEGILTDKSDVYSFGLVLMYVITLKLNYYDKDEDSWRYTGNDDEVIDPYIRGKIAPECWKTFLGIMIRCLLFERSERPAMGEVEVELEQALELQESADAMMQFRFWF